MVSYWIGSKRAQKKLHFHVEIGMIKVPTVQYGDSGKFERTMLILNTKPLTVFYEGIDGDQNLKLI